MAKCRLSPFYVETEKASHALSQRKRKRAISVRKKDLDKLERNGYII
jgi:hypothetical protein|tara:strand:- start:432 stop:572 length:141 start_codon:yes stop_codon:yes gene_type:complete